VLLRQLEYLVALADERHFGRAAEVCRVSQPALSVAIRKLERELGVALVNRQHRYDDLTPEGYALLRWARQVRAGVDGLRAEASSLREGLSGTLRIGVIPTALAAAPLLTDPLLERHPGVRVEIRSLPSREIGRRLAAFDLDAGVTYIDNEPLGDVESLAVYRERYVLVEPAVGDAAATVQWSALSSDRLCLLTADMQNRRIVDTVLQQLGLDLRPRVEADSISAMLAFASAGWTCVMAQTWLATQGPLPGMRVRELVDPAVTHEVGLVTRQAELPPPLVRALLDSVRELDVSAALARLAGQSDAVSPAL
jgi:DNA-binding transcriptional LysR family regulator